jgi:hypothetical protein
MKPPEHFASYDPRERENSIRHGYPISLRLHGAIKGLARPTRRERINVACYDHPVGTHSGRDRPVGGQVGDGSMCKGRVPWSYRRN